MELEIHYENGGMELFSTDKLTASAPLGGPVVMTKAYAVYSKEPIPNPVKDSEELEPGLVVFIEQYEAAGREGMARRTTLAMVGIASAEVMKRAVLVRRDKAVWLLRDWRSGELIDFAKANAFGGTFVEGWGSQSVYTGVARARSICGGAAAGGGRFDDFEFSRLMGLPARFVGDCLAAAKKPGANPAKAPDPKPACEVSGGDRSDD